MAEAYKQSSLLVPITCPESRLPRTVALDASSRWHTSALISTALETATLPSRLKQDPNRDSMVTMTELLNVMGRQTIAGLHMTVGEPDRIELEGSGARRNQPLRAERAEDATDDDPAAPMHLDMNFSPLEAASGRQNGFKKPHVFGQAVTIRSERAANGAVNDRVALDDIISRRHAQQPVSRR